MIHGVGIVVPVHDEAERLPACLHALERAVGEVADRVDCITVVVLDSCTDASRSIVEAWSSSRERARVIIDARNVGVARAAGMDRAIEAMGDAQLDTVWLASTDADSVVPSRWIREQLRVADGGVDAIAGTIHVSDWSERPASLADRFRAFYESLGSTEAHGHVHGTNLGVRASAYLAAGGFEPFRTGEDHALWKALGRIEGIRRVSSRQLAVTTSARAFARAPDGFGRFLDGLSVES